LLADYVCRFWGIFWIDASSNEMAEEGFMRIARTCKQEARMESVKEWLSSKEHWLLIIDNADDPNLDISRFFPLGTKGTVLITTRNPDFQKYGSAGSCGVEQMCSEDATTLLLRTASIRDIGEKERKSAEEVVKSLGYLALAIIQAGAVIRQRLASLEGFCELHSKRKKELLESGRPESSIEYQHSVYTTWEISIKMIEDMKNDHAMLALELLRLFAFMHFDGITEGIFEKARSNPVALAEGTLFSESLLVRVMPSGWDPLTMGQAIRILVSFSLITVDEGRRISMHPLVHEFSRARLSEQERSRACMTTLVTMSTATNFYQNYADIQQRKILLPHIDACLAHSEGQLFSPGLFLEDRVWAASKFSTALRESYRANAIDLSSKSLELVETMFSPGCNYHIYAMKQLAADLGDLGRYEEGIELRQRILEGERCLGDANSIATAMVFLAQNYTYTGKHQEAIDMCNKAIKEFQSDLGEGNQQMLGSLEIIGLAYWALKRPKDAMKCFEKVLEHRRKVFGEQSYESLRVMRDLSDLYLELKQYSKAKTLQQKHVNLLQSLVGVDDLRTITATARSEDFQRATLSVRSSARRRAQKLASLKETFEGHQYMDGDISVTALNCMAQLAWDYYMCGSLYKAKLLQEEVVELMTRKWGKDSHFTANALANLKTIRRGIALRKAFYWWMPKSLLEKDRLRI
jgi:tetratricopeptide (TPR) repeat protein